MCTFSFYCMVYYFTFQFPLQLHRVDKLPVSKFALKLAWKFYYKMESVEDIVVKVTSFDGTILIVIILFFTDNKLLSF